MNVKRLTSLLALIGAVVVGALCASPAYSQNVLSGGFSDTNLTTMKFNKPIRIPGVTLPAGSYLFEHPAGTVDRHIVRVWSNDRKTIYTTLLTIPSERTNPTRETVVTFMETPVGSIDTILAWFYPGEKTGDEFIYSRAEALAIAKATLEPVLTESEPVRVNEKGQSEAVKAVKK